MCCSSLLSEQRSFLQLEASFVEELNLLLLSFHCFFCFSLVSLLLHHYIFISALCKLPVKAFCKKHNFFPPTTFSSASSTLAGRHMSLPWSVSRAYRTLGANGLFVCFVVYAIVVNQYINPTTILCSKSFQALKRHLRLPERMLLVYSS